MSFPCVKFNPKQKSERENTHRKTRSKLTPEMEANKWQKGQPSPNPGGRPKKKPITALYEEILSDPAFIEKARKSVEAMVTSGRMVGQLQLKEMAERVEGKVSQSIEVNGELTLSLSERMQKARERAGS